MAISVFPRVADIGGTGPVEVNSGHPLAQGLLGYWPFGETGGGGAATGTAGIFCRDASAYNRRATATAVAWGVGPFGGCYVGDGTNSHADVSPWTDPTDTLSIEVWCNFTTAGTSTARVLSHDDNGATLAGWALQCQQVAAAWRFTVFGGGSSAQAASSAHFTAATWHHIVGTYDRANVRIYVDAVQGTPAAFTQAIGTFGSPLLMRIGGRADALPANTVFPGKIGLVRIWNRALKQDDVNWLYTKPLSMLRPAVIGRFAGLPFRPAWGVRSNRLIGGGVWGG